jgi:3D (Asp-Asp-Asp) domain-containing protein
LLRTDKTQIAGFVCASGLFAAAALASPFAASARSVTLSKAAALTSAAASAVNSQTPSLAESSTVIAAIPVILTDGASAPRTLNVPSGATVADALRDADVTLDHPDRVSPGLTTPVTAKTAITITRVHFTDTVVKKAIPFHTVFQMSKAVAPGKIQAGHPGTPGVLTLTYRTGYVNSKQTQHWLFSSVVTRQPVDQQTLAGIRVRMAAALPSRSGSYQRMRAISMVATGYSPYEGSSSGRCATGMRAGYGVVAVDPRVIPLGSRLYIEGYGYAIAGDTGGAIKGHRIDLGNTTYSQAADVGRRHVKVWVLAPSR